MTKYLSSQPFSITNAGNQNYAKGFDAIEWGKKEERYEALEVDGVTFQTTPVANGVPHMVVDGKTSYVGGAPRGPSPSETWTRELDDAMTKVLARLDEIWFAEYLAFDQVVLNRNSAVIATCPTAEAASDVAAILNRDLNSCYTSDIRRQVEEFHRTYEIPVESTPRVPERTLLDKQLRCIFEEALELLEATGGRDEDIEWLRSDIAIAIKGRFHNQVDLVELADACGDVDYTVESLRLVAGINGKPIANEIQRSNLSKLGEDGRPLKREDGKILKGPNFTPPDIAAELRVQGWEG